MSQYISRTYGYTDNQLAVLTEQKLDVALRSWMTFAADEEMTDVYKSTLVALNAFKRSLERNASSSAFNATHITLRMDVIEAIIASEKLLLLESGANLIYVPEHRHEKLQQLNDPSLLAAGLTLIKRVQQTQTEESSKESTLEALKASCNALEKALADRMNYYIQQAMLDEEIAYIGNLLYDRLMFLCAIGKRTFYSKSLKNYSAFLLPDEVQDMRRIIDLNKKVDEIYKRV